MGQVLAMLTGRGKLRVSVQTEELVLSMQGVERRVEGMVFSLMDNLGVLFNFLIKS